MPAARLGRYSSTKLVSATGQESRMLLVDKSRMESTGRGRTVVVMLALLLASAGSVLVVVTLALLMIVPGAWGVTVRMTATEPPLGIEPRLPTIGLLLVTSVPWLMVADLSVTEAGSVSIKLTLAATNGPLFVITRL